MPYVKPVDEERVKRGTCNRCGSPVLRARVGRVMALDVVVDPTPLLDDTRQPDRLLWCWTGKRLLWRDHRCCGHIVYADHQCEEDSMSDDDPFGTQSAPTKPKSPYAAMHHPVTGKLIGRHVRVTNYIKGLTDDFGLVQWQKRMVALGLTKRPDLIEKIQCMPDISSTELDILCADAKRAAGGDDAAALGTHLHSQTEHADQGRPEKLDPEYAAPG